jgi:hypothetical protein
MRSNKGELEETKKQKKNRKPMLDKSPRGVHPPDELGVLVVIVHPRRRRRHESHEDDDALTRINSFQIRRQELSSYCSLCPSSLCRPSPDNPTTLLLVVVW